MFDPVNTSITFGDLRKSIAVVGREAAQRKFTLLPTILYCMHQLYKYYIHTIYILYTYYINTIYILYTYYIHSIYILYKYYIQIIYILYTYYIHAIYNYTR